MHKARVVSIVLSLAGFVACLQSTEPLPCSAGTRLTPSRDPNRGDRQQFERNAPPQMSTHRDGASAATRELVREKQNGALKVGVAPRVLPRPRFGGLPGIRGGDEPIIFDVTDENFNAKVINGSRQMPVIVKYGADWCGPCHDMEAKLRRLVSINEFKGRVALGIVDIDRTHLQKPHGNSIPQTVIYHEGRRSRQVWVGSSPLNVSQIEQELRGMIPEEPAPPAIRGRVLWEPGLGYRDRRLAGATVRVGNRCTTTNSSGSFYIKVEPGSYEVIASHPASIAPESRRVRVPDHGSAYVRFHMFPRQKPDWPLP